MSTREEIRARRKEEKRKAKLGLVSPTPQDAEMEDPSLASVKKKKKSKSDSATDASDLTVTPVNDITDAIHAEKKRKRRHPDGENEAEDDTPKEKKNKKRKHIPNDESTIPSVPIEERKSKKKHKTTKADPTTTDDHPSQAGEDLEQKKRKKKSKDLTNPPMTDSEPSRKKSKKEKAKSNATLANLFVPHNFPDPGRDTTLPDASVKSLVYAYQHADRYNPNKAASEEWKFSKARQNWLTRHIWYEDAVPEKYIGVVIHYLKSVQGGARDAIIKGCQILLDPHPITTTPGASDATTSVNPSTNDVTATPRKVTFSEPTTTSDDPVNQAEARRVEVRRARAKMLWDALSGP
ncbi:hypothetical protein BS47DRAFT_1347096 [Hydnum rufescens UP504]|uniref:WKF domain-containing protein n=1 Tax=Hydnum rufescens UP504 TaxID=1448309 RepID=A0A9P6ASV7_9AGAM|nr:hypothetical protein BS47DRAFT_1347096 [Hydnum rufescens UP504]